MKEQTGNGEGTTLHAEWTNYCYVTTIVITAGNPLLKLVGKTLTAIRYLHSIKVSPTKYLLIMVVFLINSLLLLSLGDDCNPPPM